MARHHTILVLTLSSALISCSGPPRFTSRAWEPADRPERIPAREPDVRSSHTRFDEIAGGLLGIRYRFGGRTTAGFDCSGLMQHIYDEYDGTRLPRTVDELYHVGDPVRRDEWRVGDLLFFEIRGSGPSHVGLYLGRDRFVHASPSEGVTIANLSDPYFERRYVGARRLGD
jgi:cell wall-associated NlpC family hydrolase